MTGFLLSEKYRLEIHWSKVLRPNAGIMQFTDAFFSGPVLARADKLNEKDGIVLDFCSQMIILTKSIYTAKFSWNGTSYKDNQIFLKDANLTFDPELKGIPNLIDTDYLVIDTANHENEKHAYSLLYPTYVIKKDNNMYDYRSK